MAQWKRNIEVVGGLLTCTMGTNPKAAPGKGARTDTAEDITTFREDRGGVTGARIIYTTTDPNVKFTKIFMKDGGILPLELSFRVTANGKRLTVYSIGPARTEWDYSVEALVSGVSMTLDPRIHNRI